MKIAIEGQRLFRTKKHGMDIVALELIKNLQHLDKTNEYHIFVKEDIDKDCLKLDNNFHLHVLPSTPYPIWEQYTLPNAVAKVGADMLHCTSNTAPFKLSCPLLITLHDIIYLENNPLSSGSYYQRFGNLYRKFIVPSVVKKAKFVMTVSEFEKKTISNKLAIEADRLKVVYNGVGSHFTTPIDSVVLNTVKTKYSLPDKFILFLGNTAPKKNLDNVIKAFDHYIKKTSHPAKLVIVDFSRENLSQLIGKYNLSADLMTHTVLPGYVKNSDLPSFYNLAKVFLYPSLRESFGIPILEAMACGTPVITSNTSSMPEVASDAALLINPFEYEELAHAMETLLQDQALYDKLKEAGLQRASKFTWKQTAIQTLGIYNSI